MFLDAIGNATAGLGAASTSGDRIAGDFDAFLTLLTTQLRSQNPLDPLDTNQFTQQLVQFAGVEQSIATNQNLEQLVQVSAANAATAAAGFIGKRVTVESTSTTLANGGAEWTYKSSREAPTATFTIRDEAGNKVYEETRSIAPGRSQFVWNGRDMNGNPSPDGVYRMTVEAEDADGGVVDVAVEVSAQIDGVDFSGSEPVLLVGDKGIPLSEIRSVTAG